MPMIKTNNANFYYEIHGKGQPVILVSGYTCDYTIWTPIVNGLSQHFQVIVFDNRGVGRTVDDGASLSAELMAKDVVSLADELNLPKPDIVGQSMGGTIAQAVASLYPEKIRKLCILTTAAKWRKAMLLGLQSVLHLREKDFDFDIIFAATIPWIFGQTFLKDENNIKEVKRLILENPYPQSLNNQIRQFKVLEQFDGINKLKDIKATTLVGYGIEDLISLPSESHYLATQIKNAKLFKLNCAHGMMQEVPQQLTEVLVEFLKSA